MTYLCFTLYTGLAIWLIYQGFVNNIPNDPDPETTRPLLMGFGGIMLFVSVMIILIEVLG